MTDYPSGIAFPFSFSYSGGVKKVGGADKVSTNLHSLILCDIKDRLIRKDLGVVSYNAMFRNFSDSFSAVFKKLILEAMIKHEPRATNISINMRKIDDTWGVRILTEISYVFKNSGEFGKLSLELKEV